MTLRTRALVLLAGAALALGLVGAPSSAAEQHTATNLCIPSVPETDPLEPGPVEICLTLFKPSSASKDAKVPMVLHSHGWGGSRDRTTGSFQSLLDDESLFDEGHLLFAKTLLPTAKNRPPLPVGAEYWDELTSAWQKVYLNEEEPATALAAVKDRVQPDLQQYCPIS